MPATTVRRKVKQVPTRSALSVAIDVFSLAICLVALLLTVKILSVWRPIGLWVIFFGLIILSGYHLLRLFDERLQLSGLRKVFGSLRPRGAAGRESGKTAGRHFAATHASNQKTAPSSRRAKRTVANRRSASR